MNPQILPLPPHFNPAAVGQLWPVPYQRRAVEAAAWAREHDLSPAIEDRLRVCLIAVDCQNTFCLPGFELYVAGASGRAAIDDNVRLCEFIYRHLGQLTQIVATLDTHRAMQIFHPLFWINERGEHPSGGETVITLEEVEQGTWRVNPAVAASVADGNLEFLQRHALHYVRRLEEGGKYPLMIWPYHAMLGGVGHALVPAVEEAIFFHTVARRVQDDFTIKGDNPLTENYSVLEPEVLDTWDGAAIAQPNHRFIERLLAFDVVAIAGQAKSHCVAWTIDNLLTHLRREAPDLVRKVYLLEDCTSPIVIPGVVDFTEAANAAFARFRDAGMHVVRSTEPLSEWPGLILDE